MQASEKHTENVNNAAAFIRQTLGERSPKTALILGSGMGEIANLLTDTVSLSYKELAGFPVPSVAGHAGEMVAGKLGKTDVLCLKGRVHSYETQDFTEMKTLIRTIKAVGCENLFLTSASGSLDASLPPGSLMAIADHINMMGINPLIGANDDDFGPRFPPMNNAWDKDLRENLQQAAKKAGVPLGEGTFIAFRGPTFETPAEIKMAQGLGAQAVGMSSVPECILARHCGLKVMGCAIITNMGAGLSDEELSHTHTLEMAKTAYADFEKLVTAYFEG